MKRRINPASAAVSAVLLMAAAPASRPQAGSVPQGDPSAPAEEFSARLGDIVERFGKEGFTGAVLVSRNGVSNVVCVQGSADLEGTRAIDPETLFEIASLTKQFTGAAIMRLVQDGKLALDDPISKHLPGIPESCKAITVEHLLRHTSGIPGTNSAGGGEDLAAVLPTFLAGGPRHEPGTHWEYWNQGYALLSEVIARASGMSYVDYCRKALFEPAGMTTARFTGDEPPEGALVAVGRSARGAPRGALEHPYGAYGFQYRGMGGAVCSVQDLWKWDRALAGDVVLDEASRAELFRPGLNDSALGWIVKKDEKGRVCQMHGGAVRGFTCDMRRYPDVEGVIIVLSNSDASPLRQMMPALERAMRGEPPGPEESMTPLPPAIAAALTGSYQSDKGRVLSIATAGRGAGGAITVTVTIEWSPPKGPVTHAKLLGGADGAVSLFDGRDAQALTIERANDGTISAVSILGERYRRTSKKPG